MQAAKQAVEPSPTPPKTQSREARSEKPTKKTTKKESPLVESINQPPSADYLKMTKEELLEKFGMLLDSV